MADIDFSKFQYARKDLDYLNCPIEELEAEVERLKILSGFYDSKQNGEKLFINSVYGAIACIWCCLYRLEVAEAITLQGQDLNHYSENAINRYFSGVFQSDVELHKKLGIKTEDAQKFKIQYGRTTDNGPLPKNRPEYSHIDGEYSMTSAGDTDSCQKDTKIFVNDNILSIEEAFNRLKLKSFDMVLVTGNGNEVVPVKNATTKTYDSNTKTIVDKPINYIMRHKVSKDRWRLKTKSGKEIFVTGDHSLMVMRKESLISVKAKDVNKDFDLIVSLTSNNEFIIEDIAVIDQVEDFQDEYVYDIEVENTHTFFGNDILVHNSLYVEFGRLTKFLNIPVKNQTKFVVDLWFEGLNPYMIKMYDEYAKMYNCDENLEVLEMEKICRTAFLYAKKHYAMEEVWEEPGVFLKDMEEIVYKGLEVVQGSTPPYARKCQKDLIEYCLKCYSKDEKPTYQSLIDKLKKYKSEMQAQPVEDIAKGSSIGDYEKFILDDKQKLTVALHCPIHVKAAGFYNHTLLTNRKFLSKYSRLKTGDKCKWYYTKKPGVDVFGFGPNQYPIEFAPPVDYDMQFEKTILAPLNKLIEIIGYDALNVNLCFSDELF